MVWSQTVSPLCAAVNYISQFAVTTIFFVVLMVVCKIIATFIVHHVHAIHYHDESKNVTTVECETINLKYGGAN